MSDKPEIVFSNNYFGQTTSNPNAMKRIGPGKNDARQRNRPFVIDDFNQTSFILIKLTRMKQTNKQF